MLIYEIQTKLTWERICLIKNELFGKILIDNTAIGNESNLWNCENYNCSDNHQFTKSHKVKVIIKVEDA